MSVHPCNTSRWRIGQLVCLGGGRCVFNPKLQMRIQVQKKLSELFNVAELGGCKTEIPFGCFDTHNTSDLHTFSDKKAWSHLGISNGLNMLQEIGHLKEQTKTPLGIYRNWTSSVPEWLAVSWDNCLLNC